jgi:DNA-binding SARP family transcriptional activator
VTGPLRIYLCGPLTIECRDRVLVDTDIGGRQGRRLFAFLMSRGGLPVSKADLMRSLWDDEPPPSAGTALNVVVSKLRRVLRDAGIFPPSGISTEAGTYRCVIPTAWIDIDCARTALDRSEGALRSGDLAAAWSNGNVAAAIARRPFLPDESRPWVQRQREILTRVWRRATLVLSEASTRRREFELGVFHAAEVVNAEPYDETAYQSLMIAHAAMGNRAEALRVYAQCRKLFRDELGSEPSEKTAAVFLTILKSAQ